MLTKFFGTTKPLAVIVVMIYMTLGFFYSNKSIFTNPFDALETLKTLGMWLLFIATMFILNFVSQKNELTKRNAYRTLLFGAFGLALPVALRDGSILLAGMLVMISVRRIISLRSGLHMERKIFDATLWVCLASMAYFYSWHFIIAIYFGIVLYRQMNIRYFLIPVLAIMCFFTIGYAVVLALDDTQVILAAYSEAMSLDFTPYNNLQVLIAIAFLLGVLIWTIWSYIGEQQKASLSLRSRYSVILGVLFVGALLIVFAPNKTGAEWYFVLPIIAIIVSNYLDNTDNIYFKESLLWFIIILPIIINLL